MLDSTCLNPSCSSFVGKKKRGEAIGWITGLIETPKSFFYTGKPPAVRGGLHPLLVFIHPFLSQWGRLAFPLEITYDTPLGYLSSEICRRNSKTSYERQTPGNLKRKAEAAFTD